MRRARAGHALGTRPWHGPRGAMNVLCGPFLQSSGVPQVYPTNYFDAWIYNSMGITKIDNTAMKADYGLPAEGPGPVAQAPNPRLGALECPGDGDPHVPMPAPL